MPEVRVRTTRAGDLDALALVEAGFPRAGAVRQGQYRAGVGRERVPYCRPARGSRAIAGPPTTAKGD